ncbi:uncharacterized protein LOC127730306 [Mytilus californianus]|uniref:uncharacterized protein LOC127730306 n=1 Tax=Mytilus californianus TaxID=6549 RepID=UPI002245EC80|nr:uncharacterized protein LOC127730306 [Mytilus californianus]
MSILGEHPQKITEKSLNYLLSLTRLDIEGSSMTRLAALSVIQQLMTVDPTGDVRILFLSNGILEHILMEFDFGFESEENSIFLEVSLNILWNLSKLAVCPLQPLITEVVIRRLVLLFDSTSSFYSFSSQFTSTVKSLCENKHLVGHVSPCTLSVKVKEDIAKATNGMLSTVSNFPTEVHVCSLYDTNNPDNEINTTAHLVSNKLAWPLNTKSKPNQQREDESEDAWKDVLVTEVISGPYFWAHIGIETIENVRKIQNLLLLEYSSGRLHRVSCVKGDLIVVAKETDGEVCLFRAEVLSRKPQEIRAWALDYGFVFDIAADNVYGTPNDLNMPPQIKLCSIQGVQAQPRDSLMVKLSGAILCNLTQKSIPAGDIILKLDGFETLQKFIEISPDQDTNKEVLKLITNLSFGERKRKKWLDTDIIPVLLGKTMDQTNKLTLQNILYCLTNLIVRCNEARARFYHSQGIDTILTVIITSQGNSSVPRAAIHLLKAFVQRLNQASTEYLPTNLSLRTAKNSNHKSEIDKLIQEMSDVRLKRGEIQYTIPEDRLSHNFSQDDQEEMRSKSADIGQHPPTKQQFLDMIEGRQNSDLDPVPINACAKSFDNKKYFIKDQTVDIQTDSLHELRPNKTLSTVSASLIATHVCGMLNNRKGGEIIFGLSTISKAEGLKASRDDRDEFRLGVDRMMTNKLSPPALHYLFDMEYHQVVKEKEDTGQLIPIQDLYIIVIRIKPSKGILYTMRKDDNSYIRFGSTTSPLSIQDLRNLVILEEEDRYRLQIIELRHKLQEHSL